MESKGEEELRAIFEFRTKDMKGGPQKIEAKNSVFYVETMHGSMLQTYVLSAQSASDVLIILSEYMQSEALYSCHVLKISSDCYVRRGIIIGNIQQSVMDRVITPGSLRDI
jgi:hypothetical protein